jgi:hypothetical protein
MAADWSPMVIEYDKLRLFFDPRVVCLCGVLLETSLPEIGNCGASAGDRPDG